MILQARGHDKSNAASFSSKFNVEQQRRSRQAMARPVHPKIGPCPEGFSMAEQHFPRDVPPAAVLPRLAVGGVHVALDEVRVADEPELDGGGVRAGDVGVVGVDEYALGLRAGAGAGLAMALRRVGGLEGVGLLGRAQEGLLHVRVLGAGRRRGLMFGVGLEVERDREEDVLWAWSLAEVEELDHELSRGESADLDRVGAPQLKLR